MSRVYVYRNLHTRELRPLYSVMLRGHVIARVHRIALRDVRFVVRESGRQRVLRDHRKNVHAFVTGIPCALHLAELRASYNPYVNKFFTCNGQPVHSAAYCVVGDDGVRMSLADVRQSWADYNREEQ